MKPEVFDPILQLHRNNISSFAFITSNLQGDQAYGIRETLGSDKARAISDGLDVHGVQPQIFDTLLEDFIDINFRTDSGLSLGEQLYSTRGLQSGATGNILLEQTNYDPKNYKQYMLLTVKPTGYMASDKYFKKRIMWTANQIPYFFMRNRDSKGDQNFIMNIPQFNLLVNPFRSMNETRWGNLFIKFAYEGESEEYQWATKHFVRDCKETFNA